MKKYVVLFAVLLVLAGAGGGWWFMSRRDPAAQANAYLAKGDLAGATVALRAAVRANPDDADAHMLLADLQLRAGDGAAAEREARAALQLRPGTGKLTVLLAQAYFAQGKFKELLADFPAEKVPADLRPTVQVVRASANLALGDVPAAEAEGRAAAAAAPDSADPPLVLARAAIARRDWPVAEAQVDRTLALEPKRLDALLIKSRLLDRAGNRPAAVAPLDLAVQVAPNDFNVWTSRALLLIALGQDDKARADVDAALKLNPRDPLTIYLDAVLLTRATKYAEAEPQYGKVNTVIARLPRGYFFLALNKLAIGQTEQGLDAATKFNSRDPGDLAGIKLLAQAYVASRQPARAVALLNDAVKAGMNDADVQDMLGRAYAAGGQPGQAAQRFAEASAMAPANAGVLGRLAAIRMSMGDAAGASAALQQAVDLAPGQAATSQNLVAAEIAAGQTVQAEATLARLRAQTGATETADNLQGMLEVARGNPDAALAQFAAAAARYPASVATRLNQARLLVTLGRGAEAEPVLADLLAKDPANLQALAPLVARLSQTGRADKAAPLVQAALASQPNNPVLMSALSDLLVDAGKPKDAIRVTDAAVRGPAQPPVPVLAARARALGADGQVAPARAAYTQILAATPGDAEARRQLIELLFNGGDRDGARSAARDGLRLAPGNRPLLETLLRVEFQASGAASTIRLADELRADPANMPAAATLKGDALILAGRQADALAAYNAALAQTPNGVLALRSATTAAALNRPDEGAAVLRAWIKAHPDDMDAVRLLAQFDLGANRLPEAGAGFEALLAREPRDLVALNNLAWIYQQRGDGRARATALTAYTQQPNADTADTLGWIDVTNGNAASGLALIRQSDALRPDNPAVRYHLAYALDAAGQPRDATAILDPLVSGPATFPEKADARKLLDRLKAR